MKIRVYCIGYLLEQCINDCNKVIYRKIYVFFKWYFFKIVLSCEYLLCIRQLVWQGQEGDQFGNLFFFNYEGGDIKGKLFLVVDLSFLFVKMY